MIITSIVLWVVALAFVFITIKNLIVRSVKMKRCTATATATITDLKEIVSRRNNVVSREYVPTIQYSVEGIEYNKKFTKAYNAETYKIGQSVEIMYNPDKPSEINKQGSSNKADIVMLCVGIVIGLVGVVLLMFK